MSEHISTAMPAAKYLLTSVKEVLIKEDFNLESDCCKQMQEFGSQFVKSVSSPSHVAIVTDFVQKLLDILDMIIQQATRACAQERKKVWSEFHACRCTTINCLWSVLMENIKASGSNAMFFQVVSRKIFEERLSIYFPTGGHSAIKLSDDLTLDEKNVIMYACGYVPVSLINRYEKREDPKYALYIECLLHMSIGTYEDSFYDYRCVPENG